jgi:hypothetical protein
MSDTYLDILKAVIVKLKATSAVTDITSTRIYTDVPQNETFPYIRVSVSSADYSTKTFTGMEHTIQISVYSREKSPKQVGDVKKAVYNALNRNESGLTLDNGTLSNIHYNGVGEVFKDPDGVTWTSVSQFRAVVT